MKPDIHEILRQNHKLEDVHANIDWDFFDQLPVTKFKLQALSVIMYSERDYSASFCSFLKSQAPTLEALSIDLTTDQALLELVFRMRKLTSLKTGIIIELERNLPMNSTISTFVVADKIKTPEIMLIRALRNL